MEVSDCQRHSMITIRDQCSLWTNACNGGLNHHFTLCFLTSAGAMVTIHAIISDLGYSVVGVEANPLLAEVFACAPSPLVLSKGLKLLRGMLYGLPPVAIARGTAMIRRNEKSTIHRYPHSRIDMQKWADTQVDVAQRPDEFVTPSCRRDTYAP